MSYTVVEFKHGFAVHGDCTDVEVRNFVLDRTGKVPLIATDPPYGKILTASWDKELKGIKKKELTDGQFCQWMLDWTMLWQPALLDQAAMYIWGGIGIVGFRPFFKYLASVEEKTPMSIANLVTWKKRRAYGIQHNMLFTREECVELVNGTGTREEVVYLFNGTEVKKPRYFKVPLLSEERGYAGFNKNYPAKSKFLRRSNVWTDITELFRGKIHPAQKPSRLYEVMLEMHTETGDWTIDMFAGSGSMGEACMRTGRKFALVERGDEEFEVMIDHLNKLQAKIE